MPDAFGLTRRFVFRAQAIHMSFASNSSSSRINCWLFTNRPFAPFGYASGTSKSFPQMNTYGRASSLVGGLEEEVDCGVCGGALTLPFIDFPSWGTSSELEAGKAGDSPTVGFEEEAAMLPSGSKRGSSSSKRRGEVKEVGGRGLKVGGWGRRRFSKLLANHLPLPPILQDGAGDSDGAICIDDAQCFLPYKGEHNQKWLPLLGGPKEGGNATSSLHS